MIDSTDLLRILAWNSNSIRYKLLELELYNQKENFDIICLSETKLDKDYKNLKLPGYSCYRQDRNSDGGGVAILIKSNIPHCEFQVPNMKSVEVIGVKLKCNTKTFTILSAYKPPKNKLNTSDLNTLFHQVNPVVLGDLNCKNKV